MRILKEKCMLERFTRTQVLASCVPLFAVALLLAAPSVVGQQAPASVPPQQVAGPPAPAPNQPGQMQEAEGPQSLHLLVGRSLVITSPTRIKRVSLADPNIAEALVISPTQILVNGKTPGGVSLLLWDEAGQSQAFEVSVDIDILGLSQKIQEVFPAEDVHIDTSRDVVILTGKISSTAVADKILEVVKSSSSKVTSMMQVPPPPTGEVLLEVKFADVNRSVINQFGINILSLPGAKNVGTVSTGQYSPPQLGSPTSVSGSTLGVSNLLNIFLLRQDINLAATIQALETQNVLEILAEPDLLTASGKEASFLAGGQFPYPVVQPSSGGFAAITIQFKEYGVKLKFIPTLTSDGLIHLKVAPEVSALDYSNAVTIQGFTVPALTTDSAESEMDLRDGQSFAIAGLMDNRVTELFNKIPWVGDIPILGKLFQSHSTTKSKNELLIVVTPRIVRPLEKVPEGPAMPYPFLDQHTKPESETPAKK
jgi:pilus assembly protein CpaC